MVKDACRGCHQLLTEIELKIALSVSSVLTINQSLVSKLVL